MPKKRESADKIRAREEFRSEFVNRINSVKRKLAAEASENDTDTVLNWTKKYGGLPSIFDVKLIADAAGMTPEFLAFGAAASTPREQRLLEAYRQIEGEPDLSAAILNLPYPHKTRVAAAAKLTKRDVGPLPEKNPVPIDRRGELKVFEVSLEKRGNPLPTWVKLAAGPGRELEISEDYIHVRELPDWKRHHSLVVAGESMKNTLAPGDIVIMERLENVAMVPFPKRTNLVDMEIKPLSAWHRVIPDESICVLSINKEEPTLKRIQYVGNDAQWFLKIVADNPAEWEYPKGKTVMPEDEVDFYGILRGVGNGRYSNARIEYYKDLKK